MKQTAF